MSGSVHHPDEIEIGGRRYRIGDRLPLDPPPPRKVLPASFVDDPSRSPRGVFRNGRGTAR